MPIYEYECEIYGSEHIIQRLFLGKESRDEHGFKATDDITICDRCEDFRIDETSSVIYARKIFSIPAKLNTPDDSKKSLVYFENKKGEIKFGHSSNDNWHPAGFQRKEARNHFERLDVERRIRNQDNSRISRETEARDIQHHHSTSVRHSDLRTYLQAGEIVVDNPETGAKENVKIDKITETIMKKAMKRSANRTPKSQESSFRFEANHESTSTIKSKQNDK